MYIPVIIRLYKMTKVTLRAGSYFDISISTSINISTSIDISIRKIRKVCVNRGYIGISTRNGTFSIFLCLCLHLCLWNLGSHNIFLIFLMLMFMLVLMLMSKCEPALKGHS